MITGFLTKYAEERSILTLPLLADYLNLDRKVIMRMVNKNEIPHCYIYGKLRFPKWLIDGWLERMSLGIGEEDDGA